ncbi:MAG TPA: hypothetical protein VEJ84_07150 [Acidimicrobiales bacterium]|nr:hypothetical protein [Acidimicrobiales bacterium]
MTRLLTSLLVIIGLAIVAVGIIYFTVKAGSLPTWFPGHLTGSAAHRTKHGIAAIVVGVVVLVGAIMVPALTGARRRH